MNKAIATMKDGDETDLLLKRMTAEMTAEMQSRREPTDCIRISAGPIDNRKFNRDWWALPARVEFLKNADVEILLPANGRKKHLLKSLELVTKAVRDFWPKLAEHPLGMSMLVDQARRQVRLEARKARREAPPVNDADPMTWPQPRFEAATEKVQNLATIMFLKAAPELRERYIASLDPALAADVAAVVAGTLAELGAAKRGASAA